jgi:hypothetical protein
MLRRSLAALLAAFSLCAAAQQAPFQPLDGSSTANLAVTATAATISIPSSTPAGTNRQVVFSNIGAQTVFLRCDGVTATSANAMPIAAGKDFILTLAYSAATCSAIAAGTGSTLYATVGFGR